MSGADDRVCQNATNSQGLGGSLEALLQAAEIAADAQQLERAVEILRAAVQRYPDAPEALYELGVAVLMLLESRYSNLETWQDLGSDEPLAEECAKALAGAIEKNAKWAPPLTALGNLMALRGDVQRATELWRQSLEVDPNQPEVAENLRTFGGELPRSS